MGLSASMWTSVSGLLAHGNKMNVVGNNIANVSTLGFKSQRMDFNDYLYINGGSTSGTVQIGAGVSTYAVIGDFSQGSLESTNSVTDIAIDGEGFFKVRKPNTEQMYYTRAGDFYFNADRQLQNPEGYRLQGWKVDSNSNPLTFKSTSINIGENKSNESAYIGTGTPRDIVLDSWYLTPHRTDSVSFTMGLTSDKQNDLVQGDSTIGPMLALFDNWDATKLPEGAPLGDKSTATSSDIKIYDEAGVSHTLTVYYDQVNTDDIDGLPAGYTMYEYIVTIPPEEDKRTYGGAGYDEEKHTWDKDPTSFYDADKTKRSKVAGLLMTGHLVFDAGGNLVNQTAYTLQGTEATDKADQSTIEKPWTDRPGATYENTAGTSLADWKPTKFSSNGLPTLCANFTGQPLANNVLEKDAQDYIIEIDFGLRTSKNWVNEENTAGGVSSPNTLANLKPDATSGKIDWNTAVAKMDEATAIRSDNPTKAASSSFVTQDAQQNGYASGILSGTNITTDGVVYGYYDNGETIPLYQIALYDFHNEQGLRREGGNLFAQTKESGEPRQGVPGDNGFGVTRAYNIEASNVDMSREFVNMITTQRGFQANSKGVTTVDTMLETVIGMKR